MKKNILTITGIRPDFIRMSEIFKKLDLYFNHTLVHTGQHFDKNLSDVFFDELQIRSPDYNLQIGKEGKEHFYQTSELSVKIIELIRNKNLNPDLIIFLGDSNSVLCSAVLKKEGYKVAHIEAGMRSGDKNMLEEINRTVCDHCSDYLFVYHENYKQKLYKENITQNVHVVGNTIVEVINKYKPIDLKKNDRIILDIHRPENFKHETRLKNIICFANLISKKYNIPIYFLNFKRTLEFIKKFKISLENIEVIELMSYKNFLKEIHNSKFVISDSGTAQEECCLLNTPVIVPRDFTERPESVENNCSFMLDVNTMYNYTWTHVESWLENEFNKKSISWLGNGSTSEDVIKIIKNI